MPTAFWVAGCALMLSSFAVKVGLALAAVLFNASKPARQRWGFLAAVCAIYAGLFACVPLVGEWMDIPKAFGAFQGMARYGAAIHIVAGFGLLVWGIALLCRSADTDIIRRTDSVAMFGCWALVLPCPVCALAILAAGLSGSWLLAVPPFETGLFLGALFLAMALATLLAALPFRRRIATDSRSFLGITMALAGMFLELMVLSGPLYNEARGVFAMARHGPEPEVSAGASRAVVAVAGLALFVLGWVVFLIQSKEKRKCKT